MERNVGRIDQIIRVALGLSLAALARFVFESKVLAISSYIIGGVLVITGATRFCSVYKLFGIDTGPGKELETVPKEPKRRRPFRRRNQSRRKISHRTATPAEQ